MTDKIDTILCYLTLRCNLNCKHCGENQDIGREQEVDGDLILERLRESILVRTKLVSVTGGEPFLNTSFPRFVLRLLQETDFKIDITSNGYLCDDIAGLAESIRDEDKPRVMFHISIDGTEVTHDAIRRRPGTYARAVKAISSLRAHGISCGINSVVQESNFRELEDMKRTFTGLFPGIDCSFGPVSTDASEDRDYIFSDEYQQAIWQYLDPLGKRRVLSRGRFGITHCTAGTRSITIGPDGNVYTCHIGAFYKGRTYRERYLLGDLKVNSLDEILTSKRAEEVRNNTVRRCAGCNDPYEMVRESRTAHMNYALHEDELPRAFALEEPIDGPGSLLIGDGLLDYDSWHGIELEKTGGGGYRRWCWSGGLQGRISSRIFVRTSPDAKAVTITFSKITKDLKVKILLNGREVWRDLDGGELWVTAELPTDGSGPYSTLTFLLDRLYRPAELSGSSDMRQLGVCVQDIKVTQ